MIGLQRHHIGRYLSLLGLLLCRLVRRSGSLLPAIAAHIANNLLMVLILLRGA